MNFIFTGDSMVKNSGTCSCFRYSFNCTCHNFAVYMSSQQIFFFQYKPTKQTTDKKQRQQGTSQTTIKELISAVINKTSKKQTMTPKQRKLQQTLCPACLLACLLFVYFVYLFCWLVCLFVLFMVLFVCLFVLFVCLFCLFVCLICLLVYFVYFVLCDCLFCLFVCSVCLFV